MKILFKQQKNYACKDIYEGDLIKLFNSDTLEAAKVEFDNGAFGYVCYPNESYKYFVSFNQNQHFEINNHKSMLIEVIGNIYEHPELIKHDRL